MNLNHLVFSPELVAAVEKEAGNDGSLVKSVFYCINKIKDTTGPSKSGFAATAAKLRQMNLVAKAIDVIDGKGRVRSLQGQGWGPFVSHLVALAGLLEHGNPLRASRRVADEAAAKNDVLRHGLWARAKLNARTEGKEEPKLDDVVLKDIANFALLKKHETYFEDNVETAKEVVNELLTMIAEGINEDESPRVSELKLKLRFEPGYLTEKVRNEMQRGLRAAEAEDDWLA